MMDSYKYIDTHVILCEDGTQSRGAERRHFGAKCVVSFVMLNCRVSAHAYLLIWYFDSRSSRSELVLPQVRPHSFYIYLAPFSTFEST